MFEVNTLWIKSWFENNYNQAKANAGYFKGYKRCKDYIYIKLVEILFSSLFV